MIFEYCRNGNFACARDLFQHNLHPPFDVDIDGETPLHVSKRNAFDWEYAFKADNVYYAAMYGASSICRLLIEAGANVDTVGDYLR